MASPLISVIIPAYNCAAYLPAAIQSAFDQTYSPIEVVVVNDGSPDNTDEVVQPYLEKIVYVKQENKGLSGARNTGFRASHGQYVCFLDADDTLLPDKFEKQMAVFEREPDLGVVISGYLDIDADGATIIRPVEKYWYRDALDHLLNHEVFPVHAALIRREILDSNDPFPEVINRGEYQEDWQLWLDLALKGIQFSSAPEPTCRYWRRAGSGSSYPLKHLDGARRVVGWLRQHPNAKPYQKQIDRLAAIVEMERVARAVQVGQFDLAGETLAAAVSGAPAFWENANTPRLLFASSLTVQESLPWKTNPDLEWFRRRIFDEILSLGKGKISQSQFARIEAAAYLCLSDLAYGQEKDTLRKQSISNAVKISLSTCLQRNNIPSLLRGLTGPKVVTQIRAFLPQKQKRVSDA